MKKNIAITVQYDGTRYKGWQRQGNTDDTIQGRLENVISRMAGKETEINGAGRTDAGVHAAGQKANFRIDTEMTAEEIMDYINAYLPDDIGIIDIREASERFHSRLNAIGKTYRYRINTGRIPSVLNSRYSWVYKGELDIESMKAAAAHLIGKHDFKSFTDLKKGKKSTIRTIDSIDIVPDEYGLDIILTGNSFLYHMVRIIVGTLVEVGEGKRSPEEIDNMLSACSRAASGSLAPAKGLMLMKVYYD